MHNRVLSSYELEWNSMDCKEIDATADYFNQNKSDTEKQLLGVLSHLCREFQNSL